MSVLQQQDDDVAAEPTLRLEANLTALHGELQSELDAFYDRLDSLLVTAPA
jgi:hypothetical protein